MIRVARLCGQSPVAISVFGPCEVTDEILARRLPWPGKWNRTLAANYHPQGLTLPIADSDLAHHRQSFALNQSDHAQHVCPRGIPHDAAKKKCLDGL